MSFPAQVPLGRREALGGGSGLGQEPPPLLGRVDPAGRLGFAVEKGGGDPVPQAGAGLRQKVEQAARPRLFAGGERRLRVVQVHEEINVEAVERLLGGEEGRADLVARGLSAQRLDAGDAGLGRPAGRGQVAELAASPREGEEGHGFGVAVAQGRERGKHLVEGGDRLVRATQLGVRPGQAGQHGGFARAVAGLAENGHGTFEPGAGLARTAHEQVHPPEVVERHALTPAVADPPLEGECSLEQAGGLGTLAGAAVGVA